jgi:hypothetical protein
MTNTQETGWTAGPWYFQEHFSNAYALSDGRSGLSIHIAKANCEQVPGGHAEAEANARLIAAAPCLAEVCARALEVIDDQLGGDFPELLADMRAALSKANGHG